MKILLVSVNASFMHTSLAVRSLKAYGDKFFEMKENKPQIEYVEFTINQPVGEVLRGIGFSKADMVLFSTYIWNGEYVSKIIPDVKKILPNCILGAGGPEFAYGAEKYLKQLPALDFIMFGEGEKTFTELCEKFSLSDFSFSSIPGIFFRSENKVVLSGDRPLIENLDEIPFSYPEIEKGEADPDHKIYYYESSRGCPFSCAYCLSSVDKRVRFRSLEVVFRELQIFLDAGIKLVKFVDRTYNLNPERYIEIWRYILNHHNGKTMFHFEIEAEYLSEEALDFLQNVPSGVMQFEMGVQSANKKTLESINRSTNIEKLSENIRRIPRTIHQHLDLIAGLPFENLESFGKSFDFVMDLRPDALQLGFLKVLHGTKMETYALSNNWQWMENPVYETFSTPYLSFEDIAFLKDIEVATDAYWNKETFPSTMKYVFRKTSPWKFLTEIVGFGREKNAFQQARKDSYWFELLSDFIDSGMKNFSDFSELNPKLMKDLLRYDFVKSGKKGNFPTWYEHRYDKDLHRNLLEEKDMLKNSRIGFAFSEYEEFDFDVRCEKPEENEEKIGILIEYKSIHK